MPSAKYLINLIFVFYCMALVSSCKSHPEKDEHPEYFKQVFEKVDSTKDENKEAAVNEMNSAFRAFTNPGINDWFEKFDREKDLYYYVKYNYIRAMAYTDSMLLLTGGKEHIEKYAAMRTRALFYKGDCYYKLRRYNDAFHYYSLAKQNANDHLKDKCQLIEYDSYNGYLFYTQGRYDLAIRYFYSDYLEQVKCPLDDPDRFGIIQRNLDNIGLCYYRSGRFDSADYYYTAALDYINKNENRFAQKQYFANLAKAVVYGNKAQLLEDLHRYREAIEMYKKSAENTRISDRPFTSSTEVLLASLYIKLNELPKADSLLSSTKMLLDSMPYENSLTKWYKVKTEYLVKKNQQSIAFNYLQEYNKLKDSIDARDKKFAAMDINKEFENMEQKALNERLQKDNQLKTMYLFIAIVVSMMAVVIVLLVLNNLKRSSKHIKEVNQKNEDLQHAYTSLEQSHNENSRIVRIMAHDLKNPISAMRNLAYSLLRKEEKPDKREIIQLIEESCINSVTLINDLLNDKKNIFTIKKELVDMARLLQSCVELQQAKADEKNQLLQLDASPAEVMLNTQKMWRVISNIINNAIKFSHKNTVIYIKLEKKQDTVLLSVKDNGIGIPAEFKDILFSMPEEIKRTGTAGEESYGLGLTISRKIVEEHDGKIWFESIAGEGSEFYVELPSSN